MEELKAVIATRDPVAIKAYMDTHGLVQIGNTIKPNSEQMTSYKAQEVFWDQRQLAR